jgi:hypothetical protein
MVENITSNVGMKQVHELDLKTVFFIVNKSLLAESSED